jgi:PmbA protein
MIIEEILEIAEKTVKLAQKKKVTQSQVAAFLVDSALTRYANSQIHQNVATKKGGVTVQVAIGKRIGTLRVNSLEKKAIEDAVNKAVKIAEVTPPNKDFKSLPKPMKWTPIRDAFDKNTADCTPDYRAESVKEAIDTAHSKSRYVKAVAGSISTGYFAFAVANSLGVSAWAKISSSSMQTTVISESKNSKGFSSSEQHSRRIEDIDPAGIADKAAERSVKSINPKKIQVGDYEVVLSSRAIAELFMFLGYVGFSATPYQDGQSFVKYNLNKQTFDEKLTIEDDPRNPKSLYSFAVDGEGVPKKRLTLVEKGKISEESICYDSFTAGKEKGKVSTGHAPPPVFGFYGGRARPMPFNLVVDSGDSSTEEMIQETKRGIFVTRFHYTNPTEPTKAILTGLTRDGTFLIENGEITKPVMNLRYTDSMLSALKEIPIIGQELEIVDDVTTPAMKLKKLRFTGTTQY